MTARRRDVTPQTERAPSVNWVRAWMLTLIIPQPDSQPLTQKSKKFNWSEACERGFKILKESITSAPMFNLMEVTWVTLCIVMHP